MVPNLTRNILIALIVGVLLGLLLPAGATYFSWLGLAFKLSLMMIVMPLIFTSIISSLEHIGDISKLGRLGAKTMAFYLSTTAVAVITGIIFVNLIQPGVLTPRKEVKEAVMHTHTEMAETLPLGLIRVLDDQQVQLSPQARFSLMHSLADKQLHGASEKDLQKHVIKSVGALEFRSKLKQDEAPEATTQMGTMGQFLTLQLERALINPFQALANSQILAVIIFALLLGGAMTTIGAQGRIFFDLCGAAHKAIIKVVFLMLRLAPFGIFGLIYDVTAKSGIEVFKGVSVYMLAVMLALAFHLFVTMPAILMALGRYSPITFFKKMKPALALTFSTASTSSALPVTIQCAEEQVGIPKRISRFVLSLGSTMNMNGTALYEAMAAMFIAQLYGMELSLATQGMIGFTAALAATGCAAIPSSGAISLTLVFSAIGIPLEGIGLLLAVDMPLSMTRSMVNVAGDSIAAIVITRSEDPEALAQHAVAAEPLFEEGFAHALPEAHA